MSQLVRGWPSLVSNRYLNFTLSAKETEPAWIKVPISGARRPPVDPVPVAEPSVDLAEENATATTVSPTDPAEAPPASSRAGDEEGAS